MRAGRRHAMTTNDPMLIIGGTRGTGLMIARLLDWSVLLGRLKPDA